VTLDNSIFTVMTVPAPLVSETEAEAFARTHWGITGTANLLTGERDRNFRLRAADGRDYVLKFANAAEDQAVTDMQIAALAHIAARDPDLCVPRMVLLPNGAMETLHGAIRVRLLTYVAGIPLRETTSSAAQRTACGAVLARLGIALDGFSHPASTTPLIWDLAHALRLRDVLDAVPDADARARIAAILDAFEAQITPVLPDLRRQVLYNDMNTGNVLIDPAHHESVAGIIDFGDLVTTALAIDVAVGAASQIENIAAIPTDIGDFVRGFHATRALLPAEIVVLPLLIGCRLAMSLVLQAWHRQSHPDNPHYRPITLAELHRRLAMIDAVRGTDTEAAIRRACQMGSESR
jgi:hydroxylysine kinase